MKELTIEGVKEALIKREAGQAIIFPGMLRAMLQEKAERIYYRALYNKFRLFGYSCSVCGYNRTYAQLSFFDDSGANLLHAICSDKCREKMGSMMHSISQKGVCSMEYKITMLRKHWKNQIEDVVVVDDDSLEYDAVTICFDDISIYDAADALENIPFIGSSEGSGVTLSELYACDGEELAIVAGDVECLTALAYVHEDGTVDDLDAKKYYEVRDKVMNIIWRELNTEDKE